MKNQETLPSWLCKVILKQERLLRKEYFELYVPQSEEKGIVPLPYAAWRQRRNEPKVLEMLVEENQRIGCLVFQAKQRKSLPAITQ